MDIPSAMDAWHPFSALVVSKKLTATRLVTVAVKLFNKKRGRETVEQQGLYRGPEKINYEK